MLERPWRELRRREQAMDHWRRATNPANFDRRGCVKKCRTVRGVTNDWPRSGENASGPAAERQRAHGELVDRLAQGKTIRTEELSCRAFQRCFGRSARVCGTGTFIAELERKAKACDEVIESGAARAHLSQFDHTTGAYVKKALSRRVHVLGDGSGEAQRDLDSAFLARFVVEDGARSAASRSGSPVEESCHVRAQPNA